MNGLKINYDALIGLANDLGDFVTTKPDAGTENYALIQIDAGKGVFGALMSFGVSKPGKRYGSKEDTTTKETYYGKGENIESLEAFCDTMSPMILVDKKMDGAFNFTTSKDCIAYDRLEKMLKGGAELHFRVAINEDLNMRLDTSIVGIDGKESDIANARTKFYDREYDGASIGGKISRFILEDGFTRAKQTTRAIVMATGGSLLFNHSADSANNPTNLNLPGKPVGVPLAERKPVMKF
ncbi:MAG: hypothetical protein FWE53_04940 [Firmicutes bacterium]|nr:hypothetical protein [Bacillota bacterium]